MQATGLREPTLWLAWEKRRELVPGRPWELTSSSHRLCFFRASCSRLSHFFRFLQSSDSYRGQNRGLLMGKGRSAHSLPPALSLGLTSCCTLCCFSGSPRTTCGLSTSSWSMACKSPGAGR